MQPNIQSSKNGTAVTEESTLVLGEPSITVKVCISLKRLLIVTFNIKAVRIQSSKCSSKTPFWWYQEPAFYQSIEPLRRYENLGDHSLKSELSKTFV